MIFGLVENMEIKSRNNKVPNISQSNGLHMNYKTSTSQKFKANLTEPHEYENNKQKHQKSNESGIRTRNQK